MTSRAGTDYGKLINKYTSTNVINNRHESGTDYTLKSPVYFRMMARDDTDSYWVRWTVVGIADWTGIHAGEAILAGSASVI